MTPRSFRLHTALLAAVLLPATAALADSVPDDLKMTRFSGPDVTPSPACLCVSPDGVVYAGVDLSGSLGKGPGKGRIVRLVDEDRDGVADRHTVFAEIDNPRGLIALGNRLWVLYTAFSDDGKSTGMNLALLRDENGDGVADGPVELLIEGICAASQINSRGTDHSTNGIRMGIDGWIYIAVGDFGFHKATDRDGTELTLLGGGIVRVRPDGTEMELYTTGMRNIYDVAIDPYLNLFTRGNTNDGGGWNVRFVHHIQTGEYGYPRLFKNFADEILPALEDLGGGSGVGALFLSEPTWPEKYNDQPLMADWGRKAVYLHRLEVDGASFTQAAEDFVQVSQVSDLDVDANGQMFLSAWDGAGFKGDDTKGYLVRVVPKGWEPLFDYEDLGRLERFGMDGLVSALESDSATLRLAAQQTLLEQEFNEVKRDNLEDLIRRENLSLASRVAALFTLAQIETDPMRLLAFADDPALREFALRAATDRLPRLEGADLPLEPFVAALNDGTPRQKAAAAIALGRLGNPQAASALLTVDYTRPEPEGRPRATGLETIKNNRVGKIGLEVRGGDTLYFNLAETNAVEQPSQLLLDDPVFVLADKSKVFLSELQPVEGEVRAPASDGAKKPRYGQRSLILATPGTVAFQVPAGAASFSAKAMTAPDNPKEGSVDFFVSTIAPGEGGFGPAGGAAAPRHATPNADIVVPHLAFQSLVRLRAIDACLNAVGTSSEDLALWALSYLHDEKAVAGLLERLDSAEPGSATEHKLLTVLSRLYQQEAPYDGSWWWSTRPDTRGPYYKPITWQASEAIKTALLAKAGESSTDAGTKALLAELNDSHRLQLDALGTLKTEAQQAEAMPTVDLAKIASQQGAVGTTPIEDVILALDKIEGKVERGEALYTQQGCIACHALEEGGPVLGPFMGQIGSIMNREQIATAILRPGDTISQGFQTAEVKMKDGTIHVGFVTSSDAEQIVLRNAAGQVTTLKTAEVESEKHLDVSMMPPGLANALSIEDFVSLVDFLASKKE